RPGLHRRLSQRFPGLFCRPEPLWRSAGPRPRLSPAPRYPKAGRGMQGQTAAEQRGTTALGPAGGPGNQLLSRYELAWSDRVMGPDVVAAEPDSRIRRSL